MEWLDQFEITLIEWGYIGMFLGAFLSALILPIFSDISIVTLLILGGDPLYIVIATTLGELTGSVIGYLVGLKGKTEWMEKFFKVKHETIVNIKNNIEKYRPLYALISLSPLIGDVSALFIDCFRPKFWWPAAWWLFAGKVLRYIILVLVFI